ncbi:hypothetical protein [Tianweitania sediminis]|uniref:Uncharacterized protein n=1 Tax=Tianweitania sediminis TaxID=1502156 RepID=A0A8J7R336_9HYPH|nr:hypothetical protein [Tianweitania sediminis]MBP0439591.1 hypothetical protein [Tianweitania sediminis]
MKLKALDSFYSDETKMVNDGDVFEVESDAMGKDLIKRGVARQASEDDKSGKTRVAKAESAAPAGKADGAAPGNKDAGAASQNKTK